MTLFLPNLIHKSAAATRGRDAVNSQPQRTRMSTTNVESTIMHGRSTPAGQPLVRVENLSKVFGSSSSQGTLWRRKKHEEGFRAVNNVSFDVAKGEIFVIMGLSGSGKSTIIRMLNRLIHATEGSISVAGQDVLAMDPEALRGYRNQTINMVFQHFGLFPHKTLVDNVAFGLKVRGVGRGAREARAIEALELVGLGERPHALPEALSGGMRQRVGLARALATDAEILLMDEPFSALDPLIRKDMQDLLVQLQRDFKKTIVFVTHDLNEAMRLGDKIMVMKNGRNVQLGTTMDLLNNPADPYIEDFVAEVDRAKVLTAGMLCEPAADAGQSEGPVASEETLLNDLLPAFAQGAQQVAIENSRGAIIGYVSARQALGALSAKERSNES